MATNPYAPPKAAVADIDLSSAAAAPVFFAVAHKKLIVLSLCTFALYQLVWFYKNWATIRARGGDIWPLPRTIFTVFFCYDLFDRVRGHRRDLSSAGLPAGWLALGWIVVTIVGNVLDRAGAALAAPGWLFVASLALNFVSVAFLLPVQTAVDTINAADAPGHEANGRFTVWNWLWIVCGGLLTSLALIGSFMPG